MIYGGSNYFTEKQLDKIFKYDKFINNTELKYPQLYKGINTEKESLRKYEGEFPMNNCGVLYYKIYNNSKEIKEKNIENIPKIKNQFNTINKYENINNNQNTSSNVGQNKFYNTYKNFNNNLNNNSNTYEFQFNTLSQFSFRK